MPVNLATLFKHIDKHKNNAEKVRCRGQIFMSSQKNASQRAGRLTTKKLSRTLIVGVVVILVGLAVLMAVYLLRSNFLQSQVAAQPVQFPHIHGLGFSSDGDSLFVPAHIGLIVYNNNQWTIPDVPKHDYMGYAAVDDGFYSSGHPDLRTDLPVRLGLVRGEDDGRTLTTLAFSGESDLHNMAAGYNSHAVYIINPEPNSQLPEGMYYTLDDGETWNESLAQGIVSNPIQIAAHPTENSVVAVATDRGAYFSSDYGNTFILISNSEPISAIAFGPDGSRLLFGYQRLYAQNLADSVVSTLNLPAFSANDAILYIAVNPINNNIALATTNLDIFLSEDDGQIWRQIARQRVG